MKTTLALLAATLLPLPAVAQATWPTQPVKIVVPYATGGTVDFSARLIAQRLSEALGKSFVVENKPGATGTIGTQQVANAAPDGHTLLANDTSYAMLPALFTKLPWDHANGFAPVTTLLVTPVVAAVPAASPYRTMRELVDAARANPRKINFGSGGVGSSTHLNAEYFRKLAGVELTHVPYKGAGDAMRGILTAEIDLLLAASPTVISQVKGGKVRALAVSGTARASAFPDVPTLGESGVAGYEITNWFGLAAPRGTPRDMVMQIHSAVTKALADPGVRERIASQGAEPGGIAPEAFANFIADETRRWSELAKAAGVKPE